MERLRFLHIPKTAGSTFTSILHREYSGKKSFAFSGDIVADIQKFEALSEGERESVALFTEHAPIVTGIKEADSAITITFLRDPIHRVKSFCQHVSEGKTQYLIKHFPPENFSLDRFLESGNEELSNLQTKMLINKGSCTSPSLINSMSSLEARDAALENLNNRISHFGLQECFDESLIVFSLALGWSLPVYVSENRRNVGKPVRFETRHIEKITELNAIDIEVYKLAKAKFMDVLNSSAFDEVKLKRLRLVNNPLGRSVIKMAARF